MQVASGPILKDIVLVGGGHSHAIVLRHFAMNPLPGVRLTLISTVTDTPYSGMLPGYISGHYEFDEVHIDLPKLAAFAGARFYCSTVVGIDRANRLVLCSDRPPVPWDIVSINIGSTPSTSGTSGAADHAIPVKPVSAFNARWDALLQRVRHSSGPLNIAVVGGGAGGVELVLSMHYRLSRELEALGQPPNRLHFRLLTATDAILPTHNERVRARFARVLAKRSIELAVSARVAEVSSDQIICDDGRSFAADEVVWVTRARGADWLRDLGLPLDANGFLLVNDFLQSPADADFFAAGDVAHQIDEPREKAGVFAVRMGKPLARNLQRRAAGLALTPYRPQRTWLALISTGNQYAVASRGRWYARGRLLWQWKDWIDRRFMSRFNDLPEMQDARIPQRSTRALAIPVSEAEQTQAISAVAMRCGGCGAKVGANVLSRALGKLEPIESADIVVGLHAPDDAAVVAVPAGRLAVHSVDFFRAFIDDPWRFGRIAAHHALGDLFAMGATPQSAMAIATLPPGLERMTETLLSDMMGGATDVLNAAACALVGGHTGEGSELALGFAVNGHIDPERILRKGGMRPGEVLLLTKPIGTGTLFAAHARYRARGRWIQAALESMDCSNQAAAGILLQHGVSACTDLTGFGLLGHLVEMIRPSGVDLELSMTGLPVLEGAEECLQAGIASSLAPANVRLRRALRNQADWVDAPRYPLLFDPQTAGGLLASVPADQAEACLQDLRAAGYLHASAIGTVLAQTDALAPIVLVP